jgi:glutamate/tyrosine decarboxylase-like PLP-dependent enzyme
MKDLLEFAYQRSLAYLESLDLRAVAPAAKALEQLERFDEPLPEKPTDPQTVMALLDELGSPATTASTGGRYFGFVTGGVVPAARAASWLANAWDQNAGLMVMSPIAAKLEAVSLKWLLELFDLPPDCGAGFVTGATMANFSALAAARHALLKRQGWDAERQGLFGAPEIKLVVGDEVHASMLRALGMVGFGRERLIRVPVDEQGRLRAEALPEVDDLTIVCLQAGNVNTGSFDPFEAVCARAKAANAWVHIDGAFGLWVAVSPERAHLTKGIELADSWAADGHKWLNVPYDSGIVFVRDALALREAMTVSAAYLPQGQGREPDEYTPEMSRRARGIEIWAALRSLGRAGLADMIEGCCRHAARFAKGFREAGFNVLNDVVINQVMVSFGGAETTRRVIAAVQAEGTCWCGATVWQGQTAMRLSVSNWATTEADVEKSLAAIVKVARQVNRD